jgi:hypothetical protein
MSRSPAQTARCLILPDETGSLSEKYLNLKEDVLHPDDFHSDHCPVSLVLFEGKGSS